MRQVVGAASLVACLAAAPVAAADPTKAQCIEADTSAQNERRAEQLRAARDHLSTCSNPACPALVRDDCVQRLSEIESVMPTLVFAVKDAAGEDVVGVHVTIDGAPVAVDVSGAPMAMDPGVHGFTFVAEGARPVVKTFVVREGEHDRLERIVFADLHVPPGGPVALPPPTSSTATTSTWNPQKTAAVALGAAGVVGIVVGSVTGALSFGAWSSSQSDCGTNTSACANRPQALSDRSSAVTDATLSDVGFVAGGLLLAAGVVVYLTAPSHASTSSGSLTLAPSFAAAPGGGALGLTGRF
jgi:hypothetical protein